jgi:hypothetical protein
MAIYMAVLATLTPIVKYQRFKYRSTSDLTGNSQTSMLQRLVTVGADFHVIKHIDVQHFKDLDHLSRNAKIHWVISVSVVAKGEN